jgi:hypothetical protein
MTSVADDMGMISPCPLLFVFGIWMLAKQKIHDAQIPFVYLLERMIEGSCNDTTCQEPGIDMSRSGRGGTELKRSSNREIDRQSAGDA